MQSFNHQHQHQPTFKKSYGPPRRHRSQQSPHSQLKLDSIENFKNKSILNEYTTSIVNHYKNIESNSSINPQMIDLQPEIKWFMRPFLVNFIIQIHSTLKLKPQTLFLCWNIIDKYCSKRIAFKQHYQLIGCTSLWIASKYEDKKSRVPTIKELNSMCSNIYDDSMFKEMEVHILSTLNWSISFVNFEDILQLCIKSTDPDGKELLNKPLDQYKGNTPTVSAILAVSRYLCELTIFKRDFMIHNTSIIATTAFLMASTLLNMSHGTNYLSQQQSNFESSLHASSYFQNYNINTQDIDDSSSNSDSFLQGYNGIETITEIRLISLKLLNEILNPSEVLVEKYTQLGVISVVDKFISINSLNSNSITNFDSINFENDFNNIKLSNLLISSPNFSPFIPHSITESPLSIQNSPSNFSSFSSVSSSTSYSSSDFVDLKD